MNAVGRTPENTNAKVAIGVVVGMVLAFAGFAVLSAFEGEGIAVASSLAPSATRDTRPPSPTPGPGTVAPSDRGTVVGYRDFRFIDGISLSLIVPSTWHGFGPDRANYVTRDKVGSQDAEAKITLVSLDGESAMMCHYLSSRPIGPSALDLATAVSEVPGTDIVTAPSDATVGGLPAKYVKFVVREDVGCDPGFFFTYPDTWGGALWPETVPGDTIRVWIVDVRGTPFFIVGATHQEAGAELEQELERIVDSIHFVSPLAIGEYVAQVDAVCRAATAKAEAGPPRDIAWELNAVRASDEALAELRALPVPEPLRARMFEVFALLEAPIDVMREVPVAAKVGDIERVDELKRQRIDLTHQKDSRVMEIGPPSLGLVLQGCPIALPA